MAAAPYCLQITQWFCHVFFFSIQHFKQPSLNTSAANPGAGDATWYLYDISEENKNIKSALFCAHLCIRQVLFGVKSVNLPHTVYKRKKKQQQPNKGSPSKIAAHRVVSNNNSEVSCNCLTMQCQSHILKNSLLNSFYHHYNLFNETFNFCISDFSEPATSAQAANRLITLFISDNGQIYCNVYFFFLLNEYVKAHLQKHPWHVHSLYWQLCQMSSFCDFQLQLFKQTSLPRLAA